MAAQQQFENARIEDTSIGYEHGGLTVQLHLALGGGINQAFGGFSYGTTDRTGAQAHAFARFVEGVLAVTDAKVWEEVSGKLIRVECLPNSNRITAIGRVG